LVSRLEILLPDAIERYEQLREEVLGQAEGRSSPRGLALLMRQGVVAWMLAVVGDSTIEDTPRRGLIDPLERASECAEAEVVNIVAGIAMSNLKEVTV